MAIFENAHSGTTPAPLRQNGVAGVEIALTPLRHSGAGGDSGITPASLRQSAVEVDSGRRRFGGQKSANQLDKLRLELYDLVGVLDEWAPQQRRLAGYELNNGEEVAACRPWAPPGVFEGLSLDTCISMVGTLQRGQDGFPFAVKGQAKGSALEMMTAEPFNLEPRKAAAVLATWTREGLLREVPSDSPNSRHKRLGYVVNETKFLEMRQSTRGS